MEWTEWSVISFFNCANEEKEKVPFTHDGMEKDEKDDAAAQDKVDANPKQKILNTFSKNVDLLVRYYHQFVNRYESNQASFCLFTSFSQDNAKYRI